MKEYLILVEKILQTLYDGDKPDIKEVVEALNQTIKLDGDVDLFL